MRSIATRFLLPVGLCAILFSGFVLYRTYSAGRRHTTELLNQQAALALEFDLAIRDYVAAEIRPVMVEQLEPDEFVPESMSTSFVARRIFEAVHERHPGYILKFSSDNPRNPSNRASRDELRMLKHFRENPLLERWTGEIELGGRSYLAHFSARRMKESCLRCHGRPEDAPASLRERYGETAGFHRRVGDVIALDTIAVPMDEPNAALARETATQSGVMLLGIGLLFTAIALVFRFSVARRVSAIAEHFARLATAPEGARIAPVEVRGRDEISALAADFNVLADKLHAAHASLEQRVAERTTELAQANEELQREIADRQRVEEALCESREMFRLVLDNVPQFVFWKDVDGVYLGGNQNFVRAAGLSDPAGIVGKTDYDLPWGKEHAERYRADDRCVIETGWPLLGISEPWCADDGGERWASTNKVPLCNGAGEVVGVLGTFEDITERRRAEEAVRESEEHLRTVISASKDAMIAIGEDGLVTLFNPAAERMFGRAASEMLGRSLGCLMPEEHRRRHGEYVESYFARGEPHGAIGRTVELPAVRGDGGEFPIELSLSIGQRASQRFALAVIRDITERKQADKQLREQAGALRAANLELETQKQQLQAQQVELEAANEELDRARVVAEAGNHAKSEFLANMSHEIRTPMTAILGFADLLAEAGGCCGECRLHDMCEVRAKNTEHVRTIKRNGKHLLSIVNDILDLSKIEAGKMSTESVRCSLCRIVADIASLARFRAEAKGLHFAVEYADAIPETIWTDPTRLRQILINLASNAIKFTRAGGVRLIARFVDGGTPMMHFDVVDTGIGIGDEQVAKLFQPFAQADTSRTRDFGGTGLGLAVSKRLAQILGGDVTVVETKVGVGTRIRATVSTGPLVGVRMIADPLTATISTDTASGTGAVRGYAEGLACRILLAEDGPDNQRLISHFLKKAGADVTIVGNGKLAVDAALAARDGDHPFDVILMDMQMPVMDGYEAAGLLRAKGYTGRIIALTAHAMASDREKCIAAGCDDYTSKPIDRGVLIEMLQRHAGADAEPGRAS